LTSGGKEMNNQQKRIADNFVKDVMIDIRRIGAFTPEMVRYVADQLGKVASQWEHLERRFQT